jgi:hypothetical protein
MGACLKQVWQPMTIEGVWEKFSALSGHHPGDEVDIQDPALALAAVKAGVAQMVAPSVRLRALRLFHYEKPRGGFEQAVPGEIIDHYDLGRAKALLDEGGAELADTSEPYPRPPPKEQWPVLSRDYPTGPPRYERGGAVAPPEPATGDLSYPDALRAWGNPTLVRWWAEAQEMAVGAQHALRAADDDYKGYFAARHAGQRDAWQPFPKINARVPETYRDIVRGALSEWAAAVTAALMAVESDFKARWFGGEFIIWGTKGADHLIVPSVRRDGLDLWHHAPSALPANGGVPEFEAVRVYRVADHAHLVRARDGVTPSDDPAASAARGSKLEDFAGPDRRSEAERGTYADNKSQSEKAKLRAEVKRFLEQEGAKCGKPAAPTKAGWRKLAREKLGPEVTNNMFEVWRLANIPDAWRRPGLR